MSDYVRVENELGAQYTTRVPVEGEKVLKGAPALDGMGHPLPTTYPEVKPSAKESKNS
jgi:hypothetical protein